MDNKEKIFGQIGKKINIDKQSSKHLKQFSIMDNKSCIVYLHKIITTIDIQLNALKRHNKKLEELINYNIENSNGTIKYEVYRDMLDMISNPKSYLLNAIGDSQASSISYFKYRNIVKKLIDRGVENISLSPLTEELEEYLNGFNRLRNWYNHIPESLLTSERELVNQGKLEEQIFNPLYVYYYEDVAIEYVQDMLDESKGFYTIARLLHQAAKRDYSSLFNESVEIRRAYNTNSKSFSTIGPTIMSAKVQGLKIGADD